MSIWVFSLLFLLCAKCGESEREKDFPPLPKGEAYSLQKDEGEWSLNGLTSIASGIALTLRNQPPYGKAFHCNKLSLNDFRRKKKVCRIPHRSNELERRSVVFMEGGKRWRFIREKTQGAGTRTNNNLNPHIR